MIKKNKKLIQKGFSLIEVLITLMVLSIGITAISALMSANIRTSVTAKNQIIASSLAQEGIELVKNLKENGNLDSFVQGGSPYLNRKIDWVSGIADGADKKLYLKNGFYGHQSDGIQTKFSRNVSLAVAGDMSAVPSTREIAAVVMVSWHPAGVPVTCNVANKCVSVLAVFPDIE